MKKQKLVVDLFAPHQSYHNARGEKLVGVTSVVGLAKPDLSGWANRQGLQGINTQVYVQRTADIGTITHARIEAELTNRVLDESNLDPDICALSLGGFDRFMQWWTNSGLVLVASELQMVSERLQVGGTLDLVARRRYNGRTLLLDIKTSKAVRRTMKIQVAGAYAPMYREVIGTAIDECWIVRTGREHEDFIEVVRIKHRPKYERAFRDLVRAHRSLAQLPEEA